MARSKTIAAVQKPTKGIRPNTAGVAGALVSIAEIALEFGRSTKNSPYDALLDELATATDAANEKNQPRPGLRFDDARAKPSIYARAKKKGLRVVFAIGADGALYVRMEGRDTDQVKAQRRDAIRKMLVPGTALTYIQIANKLRADGDAMIDAATVDAIMLQLMKAGDVIRQDGGAWKSAPLRKVS